MDVLEAINKRRSIRAYLNAPIEDDILHKVLEAGRLAPSANNRQMVKYIVVTDEAIKMRLAIAAKNQRFIATAPVILVACGTEPDRIMSCGQYAYTIDVSISLSFMMLEAAELNLGTCWLGAFDEREVKKILSIPDSARVVAMTPLGYPDEDPKQRPRKNIEEVVCFEEYK